MTEYHTFLILMLLAIFCVSVLRLMKTSYVSDKIDALEEAVNDTKRQVDYNADRLDIRLGSLHAKLDGLPREMWTGIPKGDSGPGRRKFAYDPPRIVPLGNVSIDQAVLAFGTRATPGSTTRDLASKSSEAPTTNADPGDPAA